MTTAVFSLSVRLFPLGGLAVALLCLPVQSSATQDAALIAAVGLTSPATAAYTQQAPTPTALNLEQNKNLLRLPTSNLQPAGGAIRISVLVRASDLFGSSSQKGSEIAAPGLTSAILEGAAISRANSAATRPFIVNPFSFRSLFDGMQGRSTFGSHAAIYVPVTSTQVRQKSGKGPRLS